jgi:hypothetical protein
LNRFRIQGIIHFGSAGSLDKESIVPGDVSVPLAVAFTGAWNWKVILYVYIDTHTHTHTLWNNIWFWNLPWSIFHEKKIYNYPIYLDDLKEI